MNVQTSLLIHRPFENYGRLLPCIQIMFVARGLLAPTAQVFKIVRRLSNGLKKSQGVETLIAVALGRCFYAWMLPEPLLC